MPRVPLTRPSVTDGDVLTGASTRAKTLRDAARLTNWLRGLPEQLAPSCIANVSVAAGNDVEFTFNSHPRDGQVTVRSARFKATSATESTLGVGNSLGPALVTNAVGNAYITDAPVRLPLGKAEDAGGGPVPTGYFVDNAGGAAITVVETADYAFPRSEVLADTVDFGTDISLITGGKPTTRAMMDGAVRALSDPELIGRRSTLLNWTVPYRLNGSLSTAYASAFTSASFSDLFADDGIPVLLRCLSRGDILGTVTAKVFAWVTTGTGEVRLDTSNGLAGSAVTISSTTGAWSDPFTISADCEDLTTVSGLRDHNPNSDWDFLNFGCRKLTSGTLYVAAAAAWEDGP